jgi:hypothetical protein
MQTKHCLKCQTDKPVTDFRWRSKAKGTRAPWCRSCFSDYEKERWVGDRAKTNAQAGTARKKRNLKWLCDYLLEHPCSMCPESDILVLDFDHLDPSDKTFNVADVARDGMSLKRLQEEIAKCRVLCANCHRRHTGKQQNTFRYQFVQERNGGE